MLGFSREQGGTGDKILKVIEAADLAVYRKTSLKSLVEKYRDAIERLNTIGDDWNYFDHFIGGQD